MITTATGFRIVESPSELPEIPSFIEELYLDVETTSFNDKIAAFHPFQGHRVCGIAFGFNGNIWYVPIRHKEGANVPVEVAKHYFNTLLSRTKKWINHNIKFDALFLYVDGITFHGEMVDTRVFAMTLDSERFGHDLKSLARDWLNIPMIEEKHLKALLKSLKTKDYARIPIDILGGYACQDVAANMILWQYLQEKQEPEMKELWETEKLLTPVLFDMEVEGLLIDKAQCLSTGETAVHELINITTEVKERTTIELVGSADCFYEILITRCGLPVLAYNEDDQGVRTTPSFDKAAMKAYSGLPQVLDNPDTKRIVELLMAYRTKRQFVGLFITSFLEMMDGNNYIHPIYNQSVRTGRMSASDPNIQQQNEDSKELIIPPVGEVFGCWDASQIEFRLIVDYCKIEPAIAAYLTNPKTDYHQWVADLVHTTRKPAKTINFMLGYGGGRAKTTAVLASNPDIIEEVNKQIDKEIAEGLSPSLRTIRFGELCSARATEIYDTYHRNLPEISSTSYKAMMLCKQRGWIRNKFGRKRHLGTNGAFKAFNALVQSCAMDFIKSRMVALAPRYNKRIRDAGIRLVANIHDELLFVGSEEAMKANEAYITQTLSEHNKDFRVPIIWEHGMSSKNWSDAKP